MPVIPELRRLRQEVWEFEGSLTYMWAGGQPGLYEVISEDRKRGDKPNKQKDVWKSQLAYSFFKEKFLKELIRIEILEPHLHVQEWKRPKKKQNKKQESVF